jgi:hypothetical protein
MTRVTGFFTAIATCRRIQIIRIIFFVAEFNLDSTGGSDKIRYAFSTLSVRVLINHLI